MDLTIKERLRYRKIDWLMPSVDVEDVLRKLNIEVASWIGDEIRTLCPDHLIYVGRESSDPAWSLNTKTGKTFCFTEARGSNLLWTVCRLMDCTPKEGVKFMMGTDADVSEISLDIARRRKNARRRHPSMFPDEVTAGEKIAGLSQIRKDMENRYTSDRLYGFFMHPPGKPPTDIRAETIDRFKVFERTYGFYTNRAIIPFMMKGELVGFCAVDLFGKKEWLEEHPLKEPGEYRKTRYPSHFKCSETLFGYDECVKGSDEFFIVEDARSKMKLFQEGFPNTVAILGSYMSDEQYELITELAPKRVYLIFDGDEAGRSITERVTKKMSHLYSRENMIPCWTPWGLDPKNLNREQIRELM